jgi:hypothetical protein
MKRFVEGADRGQSTLLPECLDDFIDESNPVRAIDVFVDALDLAEMGFEGIDPAAMRTRKPCASAERRPNICSGRSRHARERHTS